MTRSVMSMMAVAAMESQALREKLAMPYLMMRKNVRNLLRFLYDEMAFRPRAERFLRETFALLLLTGAGRRVIVYILPGLGRG